MKKQPVNIGSISRK